MQGSISTPIDGDNVTIERNVLYDKLTQLVAFGQTNNIQGQLWGLSRRRNLQEYGFIREVKSGSYIVVIIIIIVLICIHNVIFVT